MDLSNITNSLRRRMSGGRRPTAGDPVPPTDDDLGLGDKVANQPGVRLINQSGQFNVERRGGRDFSIYQHLLEVGWLSFLLLTLAIFILFNTLFALGFVLIGTDHLTNLADNSDGLEKFIEAFFFSVQTFTTVGYGAVSPIGFAANLLASFIALFGLISAALATGLFFARFSRPRARIKFSRLALIAPYHDTGLKSLQFRIANLRDNQLINVHATIVMTWLEGEGDRLKRRFAPLELERSMVALFPLNWTVVHVIKEDSPLSDWTWQQMCLLKSELLVMVEGYDETFAQNVHANFSYTCDEIHWNARFAPMYATEGDGTVLHLNRIHDYIDLEEEE
ncbi:MAG: ion channel [Saprospiraceae bacterium]